jgi:hypothetical protein
VTSTVSLWIDTKLRLASPFILVEHLRIVIKEFNPCLQMHKFDMRRLRISSLFEKREGNTTTPMELMDTQLNLVADYLNTSLNCIQNNYNRHKTQLKTALNLLQPVSKEMKNAFEQFKVISPSIVEDKLNEVPKNLERYVRMTLDEQLHQKEFREWLIKLEMFRKENPSYPSFDELYGRTAKKRTTINAKEDPKSKKEKLDEEIGSTRDGMDIQFE